MPYTHSNMNPATAAIMAKPEVYTDLLIDLVQKLGFTATIALILVIFFCYLIVHLLKHVVEGYKLSIRTLNDQNKRYQDHFLQNRSTSGQKFLDEADDKKKEE